MTFKPFLLSFLIFFIGVVWYFLRNYEKENRSSEFLFENLNHEQQVLKSHFSEEDYHLVEEIFSTKSDYVQKTALELKKAFKKKPEFEDFTLLEIGTGPAYITTEISSFFTSITTVEPNKKYIEKYKKLGFTSHFSNFQDFQLLEKFDVVICSHVLYHIEHSKWPVFIEKMRKNISPEGNGVIIMQSSRGKMPEMSKLINPKRKQSSDGNYVARVLEDLGIKFTSKKFTYTMKTTFEEMLKVVGLYLVDDNFDPGAYYSLSKERKEEIDNLIFVFVKGLGKEDIGYKIEFEDDIIVF